MESIEVTVVLDVNMHEGGEHPSMDQKQAEEYINARLHAGAFKRVESWRISK